MDPEDPGSYNLQAESPEKADHNDGKAKMIILGNLMVLLLHSFDIGMDAYTANQHYNNINYIWFILTLASIVLPTVIASIGTIFVIINTKKMSGLLKILLVPIVLVCTPIVPFTILVWKFVDSIKRYPKNNVTYNLPTIFTAFIMFLEVVTESFPQATLQMYVVFQNLSKGDMEGPEYWQWLTMAASFLALVSFIPFNDAFIKIADLSIIAKVGVSVFVLLIAISRILVSCIYSTINKGLIFVPVSVELGAYILLGLIRCCCCNDKGKGYWAFIIMLVSLSNLCFAIGGCFLPVLPMVQPITVTALIIAAVCWLATFIFTCLIYHNKFNSS